MIARYRGATGSERRRTVRCRFWFVSATDDRLRGDATLTKPVNSGRTRVRRTLPIAITALAVAGPIAVTANAYAATTTDSVSVRATDDAYTSSARVKLNTGASDRLVAGRQSGDSLVSYLKFTVGALAKGASVTGATVTLSRDEHHLSGTVKMSAVRSTAWSEGSITRSSAPKVGSVVASVTPKSDAATVTFDVSKAVTSAGTYTFAVSSTATNDVARFRSAEYGTAAPTLKLNLRLPVVTLPTTSPSRTTSP